MDWTALFASLDLNNLVPECYAKWRPFVSGGLAWFLGQLSDERQQKVLSAQIALGPFATAAERLEAILRQCPTLHKLGQVLARDKRLSPELRASLQKLESLEPKMNREQIVKILEREAICLEGIDLADRPIAEASVAVVIPFSFKNHSGKTVEAVFKIVRPEAEKALEEELELWPELGKELEKICFKLNLPKLEFAGPLSESALLVADEVRLDKEQTHIRRARELYRNIPEIDIPELYPWCSSRVTAMSRVNGKPLAEALKSNKFNRRKIAEKLIDGLIARPFWMSETWSIFHGDPHGGNIFLTENGQLVALDWSLAVELPKNDRVAILQLFMGGMRLDARAITKALCQLGVAFDENRINETGLWAVKQIRTGNFPGFDWCLSVLDQAVEFGGLNLRAELALFRKSLFSLLALVEEVAPEANSDTVVVGAGLSRLAAEWPSRTFANPFSRNWGTHVSTAEVLKIFTTMPLTATRFWFGCWSDMLIESIRKPGNKTVINS